MFKFENGHFGFNKMLVLILKLVYILILINESKNMCKICVFNGGSDATNSTKPQNIHHDHKFMTISICCGNRAGNKITLHDVNGLIQKKIENDCNKLYSFYINLHIENRQGKIWNSGLRM